MKIFEKVLLLTTSFAVANSQCSVCGDGNEVVNTETVIAFPGQPEITCGELEEDGATGELTPDQCDFLPTLIDELCECAPIPCNICGEGKEVGNPDPTFSFPGQSPLSCGELDDDGEQGRIDESLCGILPNLVESLCECRTVGSTAAPTPTTSPTEGCSVCGEDNEVNDPGAIFSFPGEPTRTCGELEDVGEQGDLEQGFCEILPNLISTLCDCQPTQSGVSCSVCGDNEEVGNPDAIFSFPGQPTRTCGELEDDGEQGALDEDFCETLPDLVSTLCECKLLGSTTAPTSVTSPSEGCSVCGEGEEVNNPDAIFAFPSQPEKTCGELEDEGEQGFLSEDQCNILPTLIGNLCDCQPVQESGESCSVCGEGKEVNNPDAIFAFPSQPGISCGNLEDDGEQGLLPEDECNILPVLIDELCDCQPVSPSTPTFAPILVQPTDVPIQPTDAPTSRTDAPVQPTDAPIESTTAPVVLTDAPVQPIDAPVDPTDAPIDPTEAPVQPTSAPVEPTDAPVQPTDAPVSPTVAPVEPTDAPIEPTDAPVLPTDAPVSPTVAPVQPTDAPIEPTDAPVLPTDAPVSPTVAPVQPTDAPIEPTQAPVMPTPAPTTDPTNAPVTSTLAPVDPTNPPIIPHTNTPTISPTIFGKKGGDGGMGKKDGNGDGDGGVGKKGANKKPKAQKHKANGDTLKMKSVKDEKPKGRPAGGMRKKA